MKIKKEYITLFQHFNELTHLFYTFFQIDKPNSIVKFSKLL